MAHILTALQGLSKQSRSFYWHIAGVFLLGLFLILSCCVGLPADFTADHVWNIRGANTLDYETLLGLVANPLTPAWFHPPAGLTEYLQPLQFFLMKAYFEWFRYSLAPFYVTAAFALGILYIVFFTFIFYWTGSYGLGWIAVLLYASFPSIFSAMTATASMNFEFACTLLSVLAILLWGMLTSGKFRRERFSWALATWVMLNWLSIKLNAYEKLIPLTCGFFLLIRSRSVLRSLPRPYICSLLAALGFMIFVIVPLQPFDKWLHFDNTTVVQAKDLSSPGKGEGVSFSLTASPFRKTPLTQGETILFARSLGKDIPKSFTDHYSSPLGCLFWMVLGAASLALLRERSLETDATNGFFEQHDFSHYLALFFAWFCTVAASFLCGVYPQNTRLGDIINTPSIFLFSMIITYFVHKKTPLVTLQKLRGFLVFFIGLASIMNFVLLVQWVGICGGFQYAMVEAERDIFRDFYREPPNEVTLYQRHQNLKDRALLVDWYSLPATWLDSTKGKLSREGIVYFLTRSEDPERLRLLRTQGVRTVLWHRYNFLNAKPFFFRAVTWAYGLCKQAGHPQKPYEILVYQLTMPHKAS